MGSSMDPPQLLRDVGAEVRSSTYVDEWQIMVQ